MIIPIGAGKHLVTLRNDGGDWLAIGGIRLPRYVVDPAPPAQALAMSDGRELIAWVRNLNHWWRPVAEGQPIVPVPPVVVSLPPLPAGRYRLETWDTYEGKVTATRSLTLTAAPGSLELPAIATDLAVRLRPEG
ncbi:MAG: hypothetical protein HUU35_17200 [Armatimonadetes bacterium]|nr:hypothetical protein [Armatimonadota bacterium]